MVYYKNGNEIQRTGSQNEGNVGSINKDIWVDTLRFHQMYMPIEVIPSENMMAQKMQEAASKLATYDQFVLVLSIGHSSGETTTEDK